MATISEIRRELSEIRPEERQLFIEKYRSDTRSGVVKLVESCRNQINREEKEAERLENMLFYEKKYYESCEYICGIDEAGRGAAGRTGGGRSRHTSEGAEDSLSQ